MNTHKLIKGLAIQRLTHLFLPVQPPGIAFGAGLAQQHDEAYQLQRGLPGRSVLC